MVLWKIRPPIAVVNTMIASTRTNVPRSMDEAPVRACPAAAPLVRLAARLPRPVYTKTA